MTESFAHQRYTDPIALDRMSKDLCPECGYFVYHHSSLGTAKCDLTATGVVTRIWQFNQDRIQGENSDNSDKSQPLTESSKDFRITAGQMSTLRKAADAEDDNNTASIPICFVTGRFHSSTDDSPECVKCHQPDDAWLAANTFLEMYSTHVDITAMLRRAYKMGYRHGQANCQHAPSWSG